jgi:hypothetical protein
MIVSFSKKFILFRGPKCGGSSVEEALWQWCDPATDIRASEGRRKHGLWLHMGIDNFLDTGMVPRNTFSNFHRIAIVRNPWEREVSAFWWDLETRARYEDMTIEDIRAKIFGPFPKGVTHGHFIDYVNNHCWGYGPRYTTAQYLFYQDGQPFYSTVLPFESLQGDYDLLCEKLGLPQTELPRLKANYRLLSNHYRDYYTKEARNLVGQCHHMTINHFGYEF